MINVPFSWLRFQSLLYRFPNWMHGALNTKPVSFNAHYCLLHNHLRFKSSAKLKFRLNYSENSQATFQRARYAIQHFLRAHNSRASDSINSGSACDQPELVQRSTTRWAKPQLFPMCARHLFVARCRERVSWPMAPNIIQSNQQKNDGSRPCNWISCIELLFLHTIRFPRGISFVRCIITFFSCNFCCDQFTLVLSSFSFSVLVLPFTF